MATRRALVIANRRSRSGETDLAPALNRLRERGWALLDCPVDGPETIGEAIRAHRDQVDLVILAGGDGTMNAAAAGLADCGLPLGILPTGTGNDLARTLGIPTALDEAALVIAGGRRRPIDLGRVNGKHFFNVASIGLAAELPRHHTVARKRRWWLFAYVLSVRDAWRATRPFRAELACDGAPSRIRAIQISVGNGRHYGGGMTVSEDATIDDGWLDVYCLKPQSFWRLLALFPALRLGRLRHREAALVMRCRALEVRTRRPMPINTDGELTTRTPAEFTVVPKALVVLAPASAQPVEEVTADAAR